MVIFIVSALAGLLIITSIAARSQTELLRDKLSDYLQTLQQAVLGTFKLDDKDDNFPEQGLIPDNEPVIPKLNGGDDSDESESVDALQKEAESKPKGGEKEGYDSLNAGSAKGSETEKDAKGAKGVKGKENADSRPDDKVANKGDEPVKNGGDSAGDDFSIGLVEIDGKEEK